MGVDGKHRRLVRLFTLDFEASCLPEYGRSFPIEVGVCDVESGQVRAWLIKPHPDWARWGWDPAAERVHGISKAILGAEGRSASEVFFELADAVKGAGVVADSRLDVQWLMSLCDAARRSVPFEIGQMSDLLVTMLGDGAAAQAAVQEAQATALARFPHVHRAGPDARRLAEVIRLLRP